MTNYKIKLLIAVYIVLTGFTLFVASYIDRSFPLVNEVLWPLLLAGYALFGVWALLIESNGEGK